MTKDKKLYSPYRVSKMFPVSSRTVKNWIKQGKIGTIIKGRYYISDFEIEKLKELIQMKKKGRKRFEDTLKKDFYTIQDAEKILDVPEKVIEDITQKKLLTKSDIVKLKNLLNEKLSIPKKFSKSRHKIFLNMYLIKQKTGINYECLFRFFKEYKLLHLLEKVLCESEINEIIRIIVYYGDINKIKKICETKYNKRFYTIKEVSKMLHIHPSYIWKLCFHKKIQRLKFKKGSKTYYLIPEDEIEIILQEINR